MPTDNKIQLNDFSSDPLRRHYEASTRDQMSVLTGSNHEIILNHIIDIKGDLAEALQGRIENRALIEQISTALTEHVSKEEHVWIEIMEIAEIARSVKGFLAVSTRLAAFIGAMAATISASYFWLKDRVHIHLN